MTTACEQVRLRLGSPEAGRRLGQALWMMSGRPVSPADLVWAQGVLGKDAEQLLWDALREAGCFDSNEADRFNVWALAGFMCSLVAGTASESRTDLVWTFPGQMFSMPGIACDGYSSSLKMLAQSATAALTIVSPYLEAKGVGCIEEAVVAALYRGVTAVIVTHEADDLGSRNSAALKSLRTAASGLAGRLTVYTTSPKGVLMHMKAVVADGERAVVGSANLTGKGLGGNVELGVRLGKPQAQEIERVVGALIATGLAEHVLST